MLQTFTEMPLMELMTRKGQITVLILVLLLLMAAVPSGYAAGLGNVFRGVGRILTSVLYIPSSILEDSGRVLFPFGILTGTLKGAVKMLLGTLQGGLDIVQGAAPYAKYLLFFI